MKRDTKREALWILGFLVVLGLGGHFYMKHLTTYEKTLNPLYEAMKEQDQAKYYDILRIEVLDKEAADRAFERAIDQDIDALWERMYEASRKVLDTDRPQEVDHEDGGEMFIIFPKTWLGLYDLVDVHLGKTERAEIEKGTYEEKAVERQY